VIANCESTEELHALSEGDIDIEMLGPRRALWAAISRSIDGEQRDREENIQVQSPTVFPTTPPFHTHSHSFYYMYIK
jgi:hypothetical protein